MKTVVYCKEGIAIGDFSCEEWVSLFKSAHDYSDPRNFFRFDLSAERALK